MGKNMVRVVAPTASNGICLPLLMDAALLDGHSDKIDRSTIRVFPLVFPEDHQSDTIEFGAAVVGEQFDNDSVPELIKSSCELLEVMLDENFYEKLYKKLDENQY